MRATRLLLKAGDAHRRWLVLGPVFLATALSTGSAGYAFGLFIGPLEEDFGWSRTQISASLSLMAVGSLTAPVIGRLMDRHGARPVMVISLSLMAASYLLRPLMTELWHWYALGLLQFVSVSGASQLPAGRLVGIWFQRARGRAMGLTMMGNNFGGLTIPPLMALILATATWQHAYVTIGILMLAVTGLALIAVREPVIGGGSRQGADRRGGGNGVVLSGWTVRQALHSKAFYAIATALLLGTFNYSVVLPHVFAHLNNEGLSVTTASLALSVLAIFGMLGKLLFGYLAERVTARYALMVAFAGQALWLMVLLNPSPLLVAWTSVSLYGLCMGAFGALSALIVQETFGLRHFGSIMGFVSLAAVMSYATGPLLAGISFDLTGSYRVAFVAVAVMLVAGILMLTQAPRGQKEDETKSPTHTPSAPEAPLRELS